MTEVVNRELEKLERSRAEVPNGELLDLYSISPGVVLYGTSIAGDDYIRGPLFYTVGDALLHSLHLMYQADTIGPTSPTRPANSKDTSAFHFNSPLRVKEYICDARTLFYDARNSTRPECSAVGTSNFKVYYFHLLPDGKDRQQPNLMANTLTLDAILANISEKRSSSVQVVAEAFYFCSPGRTLRINKSYRIDMAKMWSYYGNLLRQGGAPLTIRSKIFTPANMPSITNEMLFDAKTPTTVGSLPAKIDSSIKEGKSLTDLIPVCTSVVLGNESCESGLFFEKLWKRDVPAIKVVYGVSAPGDKQHLLPKSYEHFTTGDNSLNAVSWYYKEDFQQDAGRETLAYNWNYNRYLDVNTVIFWLLNKMTVSPDGPKTVYDTGRKPALNSQTFQRLLSNTPHRFSASDISNIKVISIYDTMSELKLELAVSSINPYGLILQTTILVDTVRTREVRGKIWAYLDQLLANWKNILVANPGPPSLMNQPNMDVRHIPFVAHSQTVKNLPVNWLLLPVVSNLLRYLIGQAEFSFIAFA